MVAIGPGARRSLDPPQEQHPVIKLTRTDPARNMHRFYALQLAATLFGEWALVASVLMQARAWGGKHHEPTYNIRADPPDDPANIAPPKSRRRALN